MALRRSACTTLTGESFFPLVAQGKQPKLISNRYGIGRVVEMALAHIGNDTPIHLSFDVDALDPQWAPSTGTPVRGGLTLREGDFICECVHETGNLVAMDLVEVNPSLESVGASETIRTGCSLVRSALGDTLL